MAHRIVYDEDNNWLQCRIHGRLSLEEAFAFTSDAVICCQHYPSCRCFLCDLREAELTVSPIDVYYYPKLTTKMVSRLNAEADYYIRAIVVSKDFHKWKFLKTVMNRFGHRVEMFTDMAEAEEWLREQVKPSAEPSAT